MGRLHVPRRKRGTCGRRGMHKRWRGGSARRHCTRVFHGTGGGGKQTLIETPTSPPLVLLIRPSFALSSRRYA
ncbi:hypothetical protein AG1IA_06321 [Rhizoctonia solani AG-1 IA]|uniref:Uncharacterized protein n=1 Tax=Thanatephorus cucumeris (strain AG1-IA) TaxID=983506 RepID=L8WNS4_THACA|nr:hypothetical protein AG1IA_06321 [Rhizoctonia solani AG-1 IA]